MGLFSTNWRTQVINLLPPLMRSGTIQDFLSSLVHPLQTDIDANVTYDAQTRVMAQLNGQVMVLQAGLNYLFGINTAPYILIDTGNVLGILYTYNESESTLPAYLFNESEGKVTYTFNEGESLSEVSFIVRVPTSIYNTQMAIALSAYVNLFKLTGKTYLIQTY